LIGDVGSGKSHLASTFPRPAYLWAWDKDLTTYSLVGEGEMLVSELSLEEEVKTDFLSRLLREIAEATQPDIQTIIVDSITRFTETLMTYLLLKHPSPNGVPQWNTHYSMLANYLKMFFDRLTRGKSRYIVLIGHPDRQRDEATGTLWTTLSITGRNKQFIPSLADEVYFLKDRKIITQPPRLGLNGRSRIGVPSGTSNEFSALLPYLKKAGVEADK